MMMTIWTAFLMKLQTNLRRKKRTIRNEGMQLQNQYMQTLQQANLKIVQKLTEVIGKASAQVAQDADKRSAS